MGNTTCNPGSKGMSRWVLPGAFERAAAPDSSHWPKERGYQGKWWFNPRKIGIFSGIYSWFMIAKLDKCSDWTNQHGCCGRETYVCFCKEKIGTSPIEIWTFREPIQWGSLKQPFLQEQPTFISSHARLLLKLVIAKLMQVEVKVIPHCPFWVFPIVNAVSKKSSLSHPFDGCPHVNARFTECFFFKSPTILNL